jgi:hypothetical protein
MLIYIIVIRRVKYMENEFLVKIDGARQTLKSIASLYLRLIEDDFNMTIDEMADYLSCSYDYVQKNIAPMHPSCIYQFCSK